MVGSLPPMVPTSGFCTTIPFGPCRANSVLWLCRFEGRLATEGSGTCVRLELKYCTLFPTKWTLPVGIGPLITGVPVRPLKVLPVTPKLVGVPDSLVKITEVCQLSTRRATAPCEFPRNFRRGPNGRL